MTTECNNKNLKKFGREHFTYINQFFGDKTIRSIIREISTKQAKKYRMVVEKNPDGSYHHKILDKTNVDKKDTYICSYKLGYQNDEINVNDNLCQSYSLLTFFDIPINKTNRIELQKDMVKMYRDLLSNVRFTTRLNSLEKIPADEWKDYTNEPKKGEPFTITRDEFFENLKTALDDWENFGYHYFIGKGKCPTVPTSSTTNNRTKKNLSSRYSIHPDNILESTDVNKRTMRTRNSENIPSDTEDMRVTRSSVLKNGGNRNRKN